MTDKGHAQPIRIVKQLDSTSPLEYDSRPELIPGSNQLATMSDLTPALKAVIDFIDFTTAEPAAPNVGDRWIATVTGVGSIHPAWNFTKDYIYEYNGTDYTETVPAAGNRLYVNTKSHWYEYTGSSWEVDTGDLKQNNFYAFADAGSDTIFDGRSINEAFKTLAFAIATASPSPAYPIIIKGIDGAIYDENVTLKSYTIVNAPGSVFRGNIITAANSFLCCKTLEPKNIGSTTALTHATPGSANVLIMELFSNYDTENTVGLYGATATNGELNITCGSASYFGANSLLGKNTDAVINFTCLGRITTDGNANLVNLDDAGTINCNLEGKVSGFSDTMFVASVNGGKINVKATNLTTNEDQGGKIASATNGAEIKINAITCPVNAYAKDASSIVSITTQNLPTMHRGNNILYYFSEVGTGYGSDYYMYDYQYNAYQSFVINVTAQGTQVYYGTTQSGKPEYNVLPKGVHTISIFAKQSAGTSTPRLYAELVTINGYGVGHVVTVRAASEKTPLLTSTLTRYDLHCVTYEDINIGSDRIQMRVKGDYVGVALDAEVTFVIGLDAGGGNPIFTGARILGSTISVTDSRYLQLTKASQTLTGNLGIVGTLTPTTVNAGTAYTYSGTTFVAHSTSVTIVSSFPINENGHYLATAYNATGGSPSAYRNTSIIYIRSADTDSAIALDAGNGNITFTFSGSNLQLTNSSGVDDITLYWSIIRYGQ